MLQSYLPASVAILFGLGFAGLFLAGAILLGPKRDTVEKLSPFECGSEPIGSPRVRFSVKFYQVAILFLVFDIESAFMYPWAILYRDLSCTGALVDNVCRDGHVTGFGFLEMGTFILVLGVALTYVWRKKAIGWGLEFYTSKLADAVAWGRKYSLFQYPFVTACCGMEFMSTMAPKYDLARFGAEFPRFSPRQADLLIVVGTIVERQGPVLRRIWEQMTEPKWVIAFGVCASTGGFYQNYTGMPGCDQVIPVDVYIPGCPPRPEQVLDGLIMLQEKIQSGQGFSQLRLKAEHDKVISARDLVKKRVAK